MIRICYQLSFVTLLATISVTESCYDTYNQMNKEIRISPFNSSSATPNICTWKIIAPIDQTIILMFNIIRMDKSNECNSSFIQVFDGPDSNATQFGGNICRSSNLESLESIGRDIYLVYTFLAVNISDEFTIGVNLPGLCHS